MYPTRSIEKIVSAESEFFSVVLVTGARQVGKTTLLRQMMEQAGVQDYVNFETPCVGNWPRLIRDFSCRI